MGSDRVTIDAQGPLQDGSNAARLVRQNLGVLAEQHKGSPLGELLDQVLTGVRPLAELSDDPTFTEITRVGVQQYRDHLSCLDDSQRSELLRSAHELAENEDREK